LIGRLSFGVVALYFVTIVHHVDEGLGFVFGFRLQSLITPITFGIPLLMTLWFLRLYRTTRQWLFLAGTAASTLVWWFAGIGLTDGLYNHTLPPLLAVVGAPTGVLKAIYPTYVAPSGAFVMACDGVQFRYCTVTVASVLYEVAGIAEFVIACLLAVGVYRLVRDRRLVPQDPLQALPRRVAIGASLGMLGSLAVAPMLGMYMASGKPVLLVVTLALLAAGVAALGMAAAATRAGPRATRASP
jgi:hypothetical protein